MGTPRTYGDAKAFRRALEDRLKLKSKAEDIELQRLKISVSC